MRENILKVENLRISFGSFEAVKNISFNINKGETLALVGESGSGKSVTAMTILKLLKASTSGKIILSEREDLLKVSEKRLEKIRGSRISMIFKNPWFH